jgi:hypothetical protein
MIPTWSSPTLISAANRFLDAFELSGDEKTVHSSVENAVEKLTEFKTQMLFHGFNSPFLSLLAQSKNEFESESEAESKDLAKQLAMIRDLANSKKLTLNRVRVALTACRMSLEAFEDGDKEFALALPVKGDYLGTLIAKTDMLYAYYSMMEVLERECGKRAKAIFTVEYKRAGKSATAKVSVTDGQNAEKYVKHTYGPDARITDSKVSHVPELLVKKRSTRTCIAIAYARMAYEMAVKEVEKTQKSEKLAKYEEFMRSNWLNPGARLDLAEGYDELKQSLVNNGLAKRKGEGIALDDDLSYDLALKRRVMRKSSVIRTHRLFALSLFRHFILKSKRSRDTSARLPAFGPDRIGLLPDLMGELKQPPFSLEDPEGLIKRKLEAESLQPRIDAKLFGSAFVFLTTDRNTEWCAEYLRVGAEELKKAARSIAGLVDAREDKLVELGLEKRSGRAAEFTEIVKSTGNKTGPQKRDKFSQNSKFQYNKKK